MNALYYIKTNFKYLSSLPSYRLADHRTQPEDKSSSYHTINTNNKSSITNTKNTVKIFLSLLAIIAIKNTTESLKLRPTVQIMDLIGNTLNQANL